MHVRRQRLTNFYPPVFCRPHPLCALRRTLLSGRCTPSNYRLHSATRRPSGHITLQPPECRTTYHLASCRFELGSVGDDAVLQVTPQCNHQTPGERNDRDAARAATGAGALHALVKPLRQRTAGLISQPAPSHLDELGVHPSVTLFADTLVDVAVTAVIRLRHQSHTDTELAAIAELAPEQFEHEARCVDVTHAFEASEIGNSLAHGCGQALLERTLECGKLLFSELEPGGFVYRKRPAMSP